MQEKGKPMTQRTWGVHVLRGGRAICIGQVSESSEPLARCAALSRYGVSEDDLAAGEAPENGLGIYPGEDFGVSPA